MIFSDAIPVQFWLIDCDTYNEEERYGQDSRCFCATWECDDEIKIQFQDMADQNFVLLIYDEEASELDNIPITETSDGVYLVAFTPSDNTPGFCDKKVQLKIRKEAGSQGVTLPDLNTYVNEAGSGTDWSTGAAPSVTRSSIGNSDQLNADFAFIAGVTYTLTVAFTVTGTFTGQLLLRITDASFVTQFTANDAWSSAESDTIELTFTATSDTTKIVLIGVWASSNNGTITINSVTGTNQVGQPEVIAKSDCLQIKESQPGTVLIEYSNYRNYAGIINNNGSPDLTFYLRIPAVFNEERFPETDEPMQLSNNRIISLNSQVKKQRLLETDQMPNYMHLKMKEVLKHQFVTIADVDVVKEEPYEQVENTNKRWPMRRYTCWLTEKEYVVRNIL